MKISYEFPKYSLVSLVTFTTDYIIYIIAYQISASIPLSIFFARFIASLVQFWGNKIFVYKNKDYFLLQYLKFILVVIGSGLVSVVLNQYLIIFMPYYFAKLFAEVGIFMMNFLIIRRLVFAHHRKNY